MAFEKTAAMEEVLRVYGTNHGYTISKELAPPDDEFQPLPLPVKFPTFVEKVKFGSEMKEKHFYLDKDWVHLNHAAFGATLKEALESEVKWLTYCERQPTQFLVREYPSYLSRTIRRVAKFIDADRHEVVFVPNATIGMSTVIESVARTLDKGDSILTLSLTYGTVLKLLQRINKETEIRLDVVDIPFPIDSPDSVLQSVASALKEDTKLAVFDHVTSTHGLCLPIKEMVMACHKRGVQVVVDGAHCFGSVPLSMREIGADYYVANAHKWLLSPKGCAFLYMSKKHQAIVRPPTLSWGYECGMSAEFGWMGTFDFTPYLSMNTVLDFWEFYGADNIRRYIYDLTTKAGELLVKEWNTKLLADPSFFRAIILVRLPEGLLPLDGPEVKMNGDCPQYDYTHCACIGGILCRDYKVEVPLKAIAGKLYVRVAVHIYSEMKDIERLAFAVSDIRKRNSITNGV